MYRKPWCLKLKNEPLPLSRYRGGYKRLKWLASTFDWQKAITFKTKEDALFYLSNCYLKYGESANKWIPIKIEKLLLLQKKNPIFILRTRKSVFKNQRKVI